MAKIVAILQNQWFKEPDRVRAMLERLPVSRQKFLTRTLFAGCLTGRRLRVAFGDLCDTIYWEEASKEIGGYSASAFPADPEHIAAVLEDQRPDLVLCFGKIAAEGVGQVWSGPRIDFPHPAARFVHNAALADWKAKVEAALKN